MLLLAVALPVACGASSNESTSGLEINSAPAGTSILATAQVIQPSIAERVIPLTPTPPLSPVPVAPTNGAILSLAATPSPQIPAIVSLSDDPAALEALLVASINQVRAANGLPPYRHSPELSAAARAHSCDLASHGLISHTSSDGRTLAERLSGAAPAWEWPSESIAGGIADPAAAVALWMDEPPDGWHRRNILDVDQREVGAGYCYAADDPTGNHHYWTADFSRRSAT
jgi:uncharacterized protein YkwD